MRKRAMGRKGAKKPLPLVETRNAIKEVELAKGIKLKDSQALFSKPGM